MRKRSHSRAAPRPSSPCTPAASSLGSGRLQLSVHEENVAVGFYRRGCGYTQIGSREEEDPTRPDGKVRLLVLEKNCRGGVEQSLSLCFVDIHDAAQPHRDARRAGEDSSAARPPRRVAALGGALAEALREAEDLVAAKEATLRARRQLEEATKAVLCRQSRRC